MSIDVLLQKQSTPAGRLPKRDTARAGPGQWQKRGLVAIGVIAVAVAAAAMLPGVISSPAIGPRLTHAVSRGDLVVTVTEQGTLESSNNTEITCKVRGFSTVIFVIEGGTAVKPGDLLVKLDTKVIEETVSLQKTNAHIARATLEQSKANVAKSEIAIEAYLQGRYRSQMMALEKELSIAQSNLLTTQKMLEHSKMLFKRGYVTELEVEGNAFSVTQADLEVKVKQNRINVLDRYTKEMELETLRGNLTANRTKLASDEARLAMTEGRLARAEEELANCEIRADRSGLVIYPSAAAWKREPDITEGATVRNDQVLLLMPDLTRMQVKVGVHESIVDRVSPGLPARVTLPDRTLDAEVSSVASVTSPGGWWTGSIVKYDTIIELPSEEGLKPGMTAEIEVVIDEHTDVLTVPVAAVVEEEGSYRCWVKTADGPRERPVELGDSNEVFVIVESGLREGDEVVLNPQGIVESEPSEEETTGKSKLIE